MSSLVETQRAYDKLVQLLDQEIRKRSGPTKDLERFREALDAAFYLLGWKQFEHLVTQQTKEIIDQNIRSRLVGQVLKEHAKSTAVPRRLHMVFHATPSVINRLDHYYDVRNQVAHNYKLLVKEGKDVSAWLRNLQDLVDKF
jgi:hypothetical protein